MVRLGVFGGTFDPPHLGHLLTATDALEQLSLDRILLVPNAVQPLKGAAQASPGERLEMVRLLAGNDTRFQVESIEVDRDGLSFTVDTLEELASRYAGARLFFLAGADVLTSFHKWRNTARILELATLVVLSRAAPRESTADSAASMRALDGLPEGAITVTTRIIDISSSEIRARVKRGLPIHGFVTETVERYIVERALYKQGT